MLAIKALHCEYMIDWLDGV